MLTLASLYEAAAKPHQSILNVTTFNQSPATKSSTHPLCSYANTHTNTIVVKSKLVTNASTDNQNKVFNIKWCRAGPKRIFKSVQEEYNH